MRVKLIESYQLLFLKAQYCLHSFYFSKFINNKAVVNDYFLSLQMKLKI